MLNGTFDHVREALEVMDAANQGDDTLVMAESAQTLADRVRELLDELVQPTNIQALALARLIRDHHPNSVSLFTHAFDLPEGYWSASLTSAYDTGTGNRTSFACGIAPDGSVSS